MPIAIAGAGTVTGISAGGLPDAIIKEVDLEVDNSPTNDYVLTAKSSASGGLTWAAAGAGGATGTDYNDGVKVRFGDAPDVEHYWDNSASKYFVKCASQTIQTESGWNYVRANNFSIYKSDGTETVATFLADGSCKLFDNNVEVIRTGNDRVTVFRHWYPGADDTYDLGDGSNRWDDVWATNSTISTSDEKEKDNISATDLGLAFVNKLTPKSYKFKGKTRTHYGLIAQDVEKVLTDISKPTSDFAGFIKEDLPDQYKEDTVYYVPADTDIPEGKHAGDVRSTNKTLEKAAHTTYGLRYTEFIAPLVKAIQELSTEVETLKTKVATLEAG